MGWAGRGLPSINRFRYNYSHWQRSLVSWVSNSKVIVLIQLTLPKMASIMRSIVIAATVLIAASPSEAKVCQQDILRYGTPESVGMLSKPLEDMVANLTHFTEARNWGSKTSNQVVPIEPGKSILCRHIDLLVPIANLGC
jgi:hypothetical protein